MMSNPTVGFYTLGCKVSQYETEAIAEAFEALGFTAKDFSDRCDVYVVNTCTVTAESDRKCRQIIRRAKRSNPDGKILVCGCYSQRTPKEIEKLPGVGAIVGSYGKMTLPRVALRLLEGKSPFEDKEGIVNVSDVEKEPFEEMKITKGPRTRVYVKIEDGCQCRCTYCAISSARGSVRSKPVCKVIEEVEALSATGVSEVVLTGIETGSYGVDLGEGITLVSLLQELDRRGSAKRIRLGSLAPELVGESFAKGVARLKILAPQFHISVQSGSDAVLRRMKRRYSARGALENIKRLKSLIPDAEFTTDLMVGCPGESDEDFRATCEFLKAARFISCHVFTYSPRKNTPAAEYENQIPEAVKRSRSEQLIALAKEVGDSVLTDIVNKGEPLSSVLETQKSGVWFGHSSSFAEVALEGVPDEELHGKIVSLKPLYHKGGIIYCTLCEG
jgi:threonylcarbamoyladenosine tRNA methylthiotransferase MtaB